MLTLYGLHNCDTCRRARRTLTAIDVEWQFHDLRRDGLDPAWIEAWAAQCGPEALVNRRSRTWRDLDATERAALARGELHDILLRQPALIPRPILTTPDGRVHIGQAALRTIDTL